MAAEGLGVIHLDGFNDDGCRVFRRAGLLQQPFDGFQGGIAALAGVVIVKRGDVGPDLPGERSV